MQYFDESSYPVPVRADLPDAYRSAWNMIASPGNWWSGEQRIAIAEQVRKAQDCDLCRERNAALSPKAGAHPGSNLLSAVAVDAIHRICSDAARLSEAWLDEIAAQGLSDGHYVELLGVTVAVISIDAFHTALGIPVEALPEPQPGEPSAYRPAGARDHGAWVATVAPEDLSPTEAHLYGGAGQTGNVLSAMSLVPGSVELLNIVSQAQYLEPKDVPNPLTNGGRAINRMQIELLAGRVSSINECFY